jgi:hypothetical protein
MTLVYTSASGRNNDQLEHPTVTQGNRFACVRVLDTDDIITAAPLDPMTLTDFLESIGPGTSLPDGTYGTELLQWNGAAWVPAGDDVTIDIPGEFILNAAAAGTLSVNATRTTLLGLILQLNDATAASSLVLSPATWEGSGVSVTLGSTSGSGVSFNAGGVEVGCATGQTVGITADGLQRFLADDTSVQVIAAGSFVVANAAGLRCVAEAGTVLQLEGPTIAALGDDVSIAANLGAELTLGAGGSALTAEAGQTVGITVDLLQRFLADDTSVQVIAAGSFLVANAAGLRCVAEAATLLRLETSGLVRFEAGDSYAQLAATDSSVTVADAGEIDITTPGACNISGSSSVSIAWSAGAVNMTAAGVAIGAASIGFFDAVPAPQQSITGATTQDQVDSLVAALVALGLATDDR